VATGPGVLGRRYTPLLVLALVQVLLVALAPSNAPTQQSSGYGTYGASGTGSGSGTGTPGSFNGSGSAVGGTGANGTGAGVNASGAGLTGAGSSGGPGANGSGANGAGANGSGAGASQAPGQYVPVNELSGSARDAGCVNGRQQGPTFYMPACSPTYTPDPQATMTGVTATQIKFVYWVAQGNAEVNAILNTEGLAETPAEVCADARAWTTEVQKRFELYGRTLVSLDGPGDNSGESTANCSFPFFQSACNLTPPSIPCLESEADTIAAMHPAFVVAPAAYPEFYIRLAEDHVLVVGGSAGGENVPYSYYNQLAPYWYDIFPSGTQTAEQLADFYCTKLVNKPAQFAGRGPGDVAPVAGSPPIRKLGIIYPDNGDTIEQQVAQYLESLVAQCGGTGTQLYSYSSDITTAQQQSDTTVAGIKNARVTTVVCICDPIAPVFLTDTLDEQHYHPEFLIPGSGLLDYDVLGQLYNPNVMRGAFGPSELADSVPFAQSDAVKAWQDAGNSGEPDKSANLAWSYFSFLGTAFQLAGPGPTPATIAEGLESAAAEGGIPTETMIDYHNPWLWTGIKDFREVWYCPTSTSPINGQPGAFEPVNGGRREQIGQVQPGTSELFPNGQCA
jgi:hypothetical protein